MNNFIELFKKRNSWVAAAIALFVWPALGMFYLSKGRLGTVYITLTAMLMVVPFMVIHYAALKVSPFDFMSGCVVVLQVVGAIHCFYVARLAAGDGSAKWYSRGHVLLLFVVILFVLPDFARTFICEPFTAPAASMSPTINEGDYFFAWKMPYLISSPKRGDVVILTINNIPHVKRIVGVPDDTIKIANNLLYINGFFVPRRQVEDYLLQGKAVNQFVEMMPEGGYKILEESLDSSIDNSQLYTVPEQHYFALGDNRDNSRDSRSYGYIPAKNIIGKVYSVLWNNEVNRLQLRAVGF